MGLVICSGLSGSGAGEAGKSESIHPSLGSGDIVGQEGIRFLFQRLSRSPVGVRGLSHSCAARSPNDLGSSNWQF